MNRQEQLQFIDREIKGLWPQWRPTEAEIRVWMSDLAALDYAIARTAAQACFRQQAANYNRPILGKFLAKARAFARTVARDPQRNVQDVPPTVFIECHEPPTGKPHLAGLRKPVYVLPTSRQTDPDYVLACAEHMRTQFEQLYGGHWITVRTRPPGGDGLYGKPEKATTEADVGVCDYT